MDKLSFALKAKIPIVKVRTTDLVNAVTILNWISDRPVKKATLTTQKTFTVLKGHVLVVPSIPEKQLSTLYSLAAENETTLVIINPEEELPVFDAGWMPVPTDLVKQYLSKVSDNVEALVEVVGGLTLQEIWELALYAMAKYKEVSPQIFLQSREELFPVVSGLSQVEVQVPYYYPNAEVLQWVQKNQKILHMDVDARLYPRGVLLYGPPGTGKTEAAKYIARVFMVPLYRMDMAGMMVKWLGETENRLRAALEQLDAEAPCVFLMDEIEKLFSSSDDTGVTQRMLAQLLWWLQEHKSKVITIMTTNDIEALPEELYRSGRIDHTILMSGLKDRTLFVKQLLSTFPLGSTAKKNIAQAVLDFFKDKEGVPHAKVAHYVYEQVKIHLTK